MNQPTAQTSGQVVQDIEDRARAEILALMPETGRDLFKTHDERVADALIKIRAERVEKQAAERAATQYAAARQRGIDSVQPLAAEPQAETPRAAPVVAESANDAPVDGITTAQVAAIFDGIKYRAENWTRRLSDTKWLEPAQVALGAQGGASSLWNPATLARLIHGKERGTAKQKTLEALNRKFKSKPVLAPWRTAWDEHYDMFKDADGSH